MTFGTAVKLSVFFSFVLIVSIPAVYSDPLQVVQAQIKAFNEKNLPVFLTTFSKDAALINLATGVVNANGERELNYWYGDQFENECRSTIGKACPDLHVEMKDKIEYHNFIVVNEETFFRKDDPTLQDVVIFDTMDNLIRRVWFYRPLLVDSEAVVNLVNQQTEAHNEKNLERFLSTYSKDAALISLPAGNILAQGEEALRKHYVSRFENSPDLHAEMPRRIAIGNIVVDYEEVVLKKGDPMINAVVIYEIMNHLIQRVWFISPQ